MAQWLVVRCRSSGGARDRRALLILYISTQTGRRDEHQLKATEGLLRSSCDWRSHHNRKIRPHTKWNLIFNFSDGNPDLRWKQEAVAKKEKKKTKTNKGLQAQLLRKGTQLLFSKVVAKVQLVWIGSVPLCQSDSGSFFLASPQNHWPKHTLVTKMEAALLTDRNQPPVSRRSRVHECRPPSGFTSPRVHFVTRSLVGVAFQ